MSIEGSIGTEGTWWRGSPSARRGRQMPRTQPNSSARLFVANERRSIETNAYGVWTWRRRFRRRKEKSPRPSAHHEEHFFRARFRENPKATTLGDNRRRAQSSPRMKSSLL